MRVNQSDVSQPQLKQKFESLCLKIHQYNKKLMYLFQMSFVYFIKKCIESKVNCGILSILFCTTEHQRVAHQDHDT